MLPCFRCNYLLLPCSIIIKKWLTGLYNLAAAIPAGALLIIQGLKLYAIKSPIVDI
jgi:hypothetical protein